MYFSKLSFQTYNTDDLLIIGSLIEKEGLDYQDKKNISSVIMNRLNKNMKLQIDATVLYALTSGSFNLNRKITFNCRVLSGLIRTIGVFH